MPRRTRSPRQLRSTMDSVMLHDMKNMGLRLGLVLANLEDHYGDPEFKRSMSELLNATLEKLDAIVGRVSAQQAGTDVEAPVDVNDLVSDVLRRVQGRSSRGADRVQSEPGEAPKVLGDPYLLRDAIGSVYQNALEAVGPSGTVVVRTGALQRRKKPWAFVEIRDDGAGMSQDFLEKRLFRPFQTTKDAGVGLGLFTALQIVRNHGGDIQVESRVGAGTTVRVLLPGLR